MASQELVTYGEYGAKSLVNGSWSSSSVIFLMSIFMMSRDYFEKLAMTYFGIRKTLIPVASMSGEYIAVIQ